MFQIKNNKVVLNKTRTLTPKQLNIIQTLNSELDRNAYIMSLMGLIKNRLRIPKPHTIHQLDPLSNKPKNQFLSRMKRIKDTNANHKPTQDGIGQWVGVEIECIVPHRHGPERECICSYDADGDLDQECDSCLTGHWSEESAHQWLRQHLEKAGVARVNVKYDGSLSDEGGHGAECTILFNTKHGFEPLERLCKALIDANCYVNKTCGLHVHLDARNLTPKKVKKIGASIGHALPVLKYLVPKSRHNNQYCKLDVSSIRKNSERYYAVNLTSFHKYNTIEIRLHGGSINAIKIKNWIELLKFLGNAKLTKDVTTFQDLIDLGLSEDLVAYADSRISELNSDAWPKLMPTEIEFSPWPRVVELIEPGV